MRLGVSLASFAAAAETTNAVDRAPELGSQAERLGLDSAWFADGQLRHACGGLGSGPSTRHARRTGARHHRCPDHAGEGEDSNCTAQTAD